MPHFDVQNYQQSLFLNSATMKRLQHLSECIRKIGKSLMAVYDKVPVSDESAERELTRNTEFVARFTRNYLYRIHRQVSTVCFSFNNKSECISNLLKVYNTFINHFNRCIRLIHI